MLAPSWWMLGGALALVALQTVNLYRVEAQYEARLAQHEQAAREAVVAARTEEQRRTTAAQLEVEHARAKAQALSADLASARVAGVRLRDALATQRLVPSGATPASGSDAAPATPDLSALVQQRLDEAAEQLADFADRAHLAGATCQRLYGTLTPPGATTPSATP